MRRSLGVLGTVAFVAGVAAACGPGGDDGDRRGASATSTGAVRSTIAATTTSDAPASTTTAGTVGATTSSIPLTPTTEPPPIDPVAAITDDGRVVVLDADLGTELDQLASVAVGDESELGEIAISHGLGVVYYSEPHQDSGRIWAVPIAGGEPKLLGPGSAPAIDPGGTTLAFIRLPNTIVLLDAATGEERLSVTWDPADEDFFHLGGYITRLEWSPDGAALLFETVYEGTETLVLRPDEDRTLTEAEPVANDMESPTWAGTDLIEGVRWCCYPEYTEPRMLHIYELGDADEPALEIDRAVYAIDRRPLGDRSAEINLDQSEGAGTVTLRGVAGREAWTTAGRFVAVSA